MKKTVIFDLDDTLIGSRYDSNSNDGATTYVSRPCAQEVLSQAQSDFDKVVLWTHHGPREQVESLLESLELYSYFAEIIGEDAPALQPTGKGLIRKDLYAYCREFETSLFDVVMIQDTLHQMDGLVKPVFPEHRWIQVKPIDITPYELNRDTELVDAYRRAFDLCKS